MEYLPIAFLLWFCVGVNDLYDVLLYFVIFFFKCEVLERNLFHLFVQHTPLSMLVSSSQECNYQFDNRRKHMTAAQCTEKHLFRPFSHE